MESKALENGYKFVWEFTPSQGNGTISAVALTSAQGGENGFGSLVGDASTFLQIKDVDIGDMGKAEQMMLFETVQVDFEKNLLYSITFADASVRIRKIRLPIFSIGLNEKLGDSTYTVLEDKTITTETFRFLGSYTKYGEFMDGQDGYWYGFSNEGNSSGSSTMLWIKSSKADYSFTEGTWTLSNAKLMAVGELDADDSFPERTVKCCMRSGYLYVPANDKKGIYKINVSNPSDRNDAATPLFQYKNFLVGWGGSYGSEFRTTYLLTPYLASINNLSEAVVKTVDKTMKITYTLTE